MNFLLLQSREIVVSFKTSSGITSSFTSFQNHLYNQICHYTLDFLPHFLFYDSERGYFATKRVLKDNSLQDVDNGRFDKGCIWYSFQLNQKPYFLKYNSIKSQMKWIEFEEKKYKIMNTFPWKDEISLIVPFKNNQENHFLFYNKNSGKTTIFKLKDGFNLELVYEISLPKFLDQILDLGNHFYCYSIKTGLLIYLKFKEKESKMKINFTDTGLYLFSYSNEIYSYDYSTGKTKNENTLETFQLPKGLNTVIPFYKEDYINVMSFNILNNAHIHENGIESVAEIIKVHKIDILGMQEMRDPKAMKKLQNILGDEYYYDYDLQLISRFKILKKYQVDGATVFGCLLELNQNQKIKFFNSHLTAYPYGPYELREGLSIDKCLEKIQHQKKEVEFAIQFLFFKDELECPILLTGDHNIPSHLDHCLQTSLDYHYSKLRNLKTLPVEWPVSKTLQEHGFIDSYREIYPNPLEFHGISWNLGEPNKLLDHNEVFDRIDYIYYKNGKSKVKNLSIYYVDTIYSPFNYPSDHRAVVGRFKILDE